MRELTLFALCSIIKPVDMINLCSGVHKETSGCSQKDLERMVDKCLKEGHDELMVDLKSADSLPLVQRFLLTNYFYSVAVESVEKMSYVILRLGSLSPIFRLVLDPDRSETDLNLKMVQWIHSLSSGNVGEYELKSLRECLEDWGPRKFNFNVRLIASLLIHADILLMIGCLIMKYFIV